jgi:hypothetical protein
VTTSQIIPKYQILGFADSPEMGHTLPQVIIKCFHHIQPIKPSPFMNREAKKRLSSALTCAEKSIKQRSRDLGIFSRPGLAILLPYLP